MGRRDAEWARHCNDQIGCPGMPSWNAGADHCHAISVHSGAERSAQADGVRKLFPRLPNAFSAVLPAIAQPRTMSEASSLIVPAKPARREHVPLGILYMVSATIVFAVSSAISKWLVASYPVGEVLFTRTSVALLTCALFILPHTGLAVFRTQRLRHHVLRSVSQGCSQTFLLIAFSLMPLAGATAINFSSPLFATLASALLLKETVGLARWLALLVGFGGVLIVTAPGAGAYQVGALFALANAILYGSVTAGVRGMTTTESAQNADPLPTGAAHRLLRTAAALGLDLAHAGRHRVDRVQRRLQCRGTILVDARAAPRAGFRGGPVQLSLPHLGEYFGIRDLGRCANRVSRDRLRRRGRVGSVPVLARKQRSPAKAARQRVNACLTPRADSGRIHL